MKDRVAKYGSPVPNIQKIASRWSIIVGATVTPEDVCSMMIELKQVREEAHHLQDNIDDIQGYEYIRRLCEEARTK